MKSSDGLLPPEGLPCGVRMAADAGAHLWRVLRGKRWKVVGVSAHHREGAVQVSGAASPRWRQALAIEPHNSLILKD
jgi:hypothetical protein